MAGVGAASNGTYMGAGGAGDGVKHFDDDDDESEMMRAAPEDGDSTIHKQASNVAGFDDEPQPKGSVYNK